MTIYISDKVRQGIRNYYVVTASHHWELETVAHIYGARILGNRATGYYLEVGERERMRGIAFEDVAVKPKPREDPRIAEKERASGRYGDSSRIVDSLEGQRSHALGGGREMGPLPAGSGVGSTAVSGAGGGLERDGRRTDSSTVIVNLDKNLQKPI